MPKELIEQFIVDNFLFGDKARLDIDTSFQDEGIIDSTGILELILFLEETFDIQIEDQELVPENMDSLNKIESFLLQKKPVVI
jgi:acyl carrier protein